MSGSTQQYVGPNAVWAGGLTCLPQIIPAYVFQQYADDDNIQAVFTAQNEYATQFLLWFNTLNLPIYTGGIVSGALLDWVAQGVYGMARPSVTTGTKRTVGATNALPTDVKATNAQRITSTETLQSTSDDIFRRVLTWNFYKGDGFVFSIQWLKRRVYRFINGANGISPTINQTYSVGISVVGNLFTIGGTAGYAGIISILNSLIQSGACITPFQYQFVVQVQVGNLYSNGGVLSLFSSAGWPTGITTGGAMWSNGGEVTAGPGGTLDPSAPPVYFGYATSAQMLLLNAGKFPWTAPTAGSGQLWNPGGASGGPIYIA